jgi:hypothetical protein
MPKKEIIQKVGEKNQHGYGEKGNEFGILFWFGHGFYFSRGRSMPEAGVA